MPELPEVETVARQLREGGARGPSVIGRTVRAVTVTWPRHIATPTPAELQARLPGQTVLAAGRRGKYLVFTLTQDTLLIHLKMTGDLTVCPSDQPPHPHDRTVFHFDDGFDLRFNDARRFGKVYLAATAQAITGHLGPEPLEATFGPAQLAHCLHGTRRALKTVLLDQTRLAGVGNVYADEALHRAGLHPLHPANTLTPAQVHALWRSIRAVLRLGIRHNGVSLDWAYRGGSFQNLTRVYGRTDLPCQTCGTPIRRLVIGQRSAHFCPVCQPSEAT